MCSEKRRLANQRNAQKSTGPKTEEGKLRSRRNALKHGLTGSGAVMSRPDEEKYQAKLKQMREQLEPIDPLEEILVARVALASVRMDKCLKKEFAELNKCRTRALRRWETTQLAEAQAAAQRLADGNPADAVATLEATSVGCDLLINAWNELETLLTENGQWTAEQTSAALRLLGVAPGDGEALDNDNLDDLARALWTHAQALAQPAEAETVDRDASRTALLARIAAERKRLDDLAETRWHEHDEPARAEVEDCASLDDSERGRRLHRYETAAEMSFHRNLKQLISQRRIEPEEQSVKRWHLTGKLKPRRWNGLAYEPTNPYYTANTMTDDVDDDPRAGRTDPRHQAAGPQPGNTPPPAQAGAEDEANEPAESAAPACTSDDRAGVTAGAPATPAQGGYESISPARPGQEPPMG